VFMSGYAGDDVARRGIDAIGARIVTKPFAAGELVDAVFAALVHA
jgi:hypothetical protein